MSGIFKLSNECTKFKKEREKMPRSERAVEQLWEAAFDGDEALVKEVKGIAAFRAKNAVRKSAKGTIPCFMVEQMLEAVVRIGEREKNVGDEVSKEEREKIAVEENTTAQFNTLRREFVRIAMMDSHPIDGLHARLTKAQGKEAKALARARTRKGADVAAIDKQIEDLPKKYEKLLNEDISTYKTWYLGTMNQQKLFDSDKEMIKLSSPALSEPPNALLAAEEKEIKAGSNTVGSGKLAPAVVRFLSAVKERLGGKINFSGNGYGKSHSWWIYSADLWPRMKRVDGFFETEGLTALFRAALQVAKSTGVRWRALYNNYEAAKEINKEARQQLVRFQYIHGPDPYKNHIHMDIMPANGWPKAPNAQGQSAKPTPWKR